MASEPGKPKKSGLAPLIAVFGVITVVSLGIGWFIGSQIRQTVETEMAPNADVAAMTGEADAAARPNTEDADERAAIGRHPGDSKKKKKVDDHGTDHVSADDEHSVGGLFGSGPEAVRLDPIVANLGTAEGQWIRLEIAIVYRKGADSSSEPEKLAVNEAIIGMLRSKSPEDLAGPSGFLQFREDLTDAVMLSTGGKARSAKILSMVLE